MIKPPPHGLPDGMSAHAPANSIKYYVLARSQKEFVEWAKRKGGERGGPKLQDCNYIGTSAGMKGLGFTDPNVELVTLPDWFKGKGDEFYQDGCQLISRYCVDKRKHDCLHY